jgi:hypothetical protein
MSSVLKIIGITFDANTAAIINVTPSKNPNNIKPLSIFIVIIIIIIIIIITF